MEDVEVLFLVSRPESGPILRGLLRACARRKTPCACFFTGAAAVLAVDPEIGALVRESPRSAVCEDSWERFGHGECPMHLGSQTDNSAMAAVARRIVSL